MEKIILVKELGFLSATDHISLRGRSFLQDNSSLEWLTNTWQRLPLVDGSFDNIPAGVVPYFSMLKKSDVASRDNVPSHLVKEVEGAVINIADGK